MNFRNLFNKKQTTPEAPASSNAGQKKRVYNLIILDESGSMSCIRKSALSGAIETIQTISKSAQEDSNLEQYLTLVTFSSGQNYLKTIYDLAPIANVDTQVLNNYSPNGCTALYDAIGESLTKLNGQITEHDAAVVTIITDGAENASRKYSAQAIKEFIATLEKRDWVFTFIGANQDAMYEGERIGIHNTLQWDNDEQGTRDMWERDMHHRRQMYWKMAHGRFDKKGYYNDDDEFIREYCNVQCGITPEHITSLQPNEIFVFGSNTHGVHSGGAARLAMERFGAIMGEPFGIQGQSYAIPTVGLDLQGIAKHVNMFLADAQKFPNTRFLVTRIGCGIAGWSVEQIAPLFEPAISMPNISLPKQFIDVIIRKMH